MATLFGFFLAPLLIIMCLMASTSLSLPYFHNQINLQTSTKSSPIISSQPAVMPSSSSSASSHPLTTQLSPDISPLLPSPGGKTTPTTSIPIIPSNPSPPNPDEISTFNPDAALSPSGSLPDSSALSLYLASSKLSFAPIVVGIFVIFIQPVAI